MVTIGYILRHIREDKQFPLQQVSESSGIDATLLGKIEAGKRVATTEQLLKLAYVYELDEVAAFLNTADTDIEIKAIQAAETKTVYGSPYLSLFMEALYSKPIALESRRYIGSKAKLVGWIMNTIKKETKDVHTFFDVFAGTGVVTKAALNSFDHVFTNDFLHSNNIIYKAFFGDAIMTKRR